MCRDQMRILNRFRVFLQSMYISEISDISGKFILPNIVNCIQYRSSLWEWPKQECPKHHNKLWKRACKVMQDHLHTHRLGKWCTQIQSWNWKISDCSSYVVHPKLGSFELNQSRYKSFYGACDSVPVECKIEADMFIKRD